MKWAIFVFIRVICVRKKMNPRCSATHATFATQVSIPPKSYAFHL